MELFYATAGCRYCNILMHLNAFAIFQIFQTVLRKAKKIEITGQSRLIKFWHKQVICCNCTKLVVQEYLTFNSYVHTFGNSLFYGTPSWLWYWICIPLVYFCGGPNYEPYNVCLNICLDDAQNFVQFQFHLQFHFDLVYLLVLLKVFKLFRKIYYLSF